jgi:TolB-like protein/DNA-binding winged helix-turn-helix (wHTH) protein/Flp pilus assembly protein TadD
VVAVAEKSPVSPSPVYRFGVFQANPAARELRKHGVHVRLPGQPFCILSMLLERPGEVVTREEMRQRLWAADTFVDFEHSLNTAIKKLRAALGDSPENSRYIETLPRLGYRFIAPVEEVSAKAGSAADAPLDTARSGVAAAAEQPPKRRWPIVLGVFTALLAALGAYISWSPRWLRTRPATGRAMLAVLPFENLTGDAGQDYFSDGLTEEMIAQLGRLDPQHLGVIARTSVMHYKHGQEQLDQISRELGVQYVLEGSVRRDADKVRISAQLVQMKDQTHVWVRQYDRDLGHLLVLQGEIAQEIAGEIKLALGDQKRVPANVKVVAPPGSYEAYDLYLKGRFFWNKRTAEGLHQATEYFQQAVAKDNNYGRAYAGLADSYALMSTYNWAPPNELMPKARAAALRALQIDDSLSEAHTSLALITEIYDWDWQTSEREFRRAIELDPNYATAHQWYAEYLTWQGRFEEAARESERARQLDPLSLIIATDRAAMFYFSRHYDRALEHFHSVLAMEPSFGRARLVIYAYAEKGMFTEALAEIQKWHHDDGTPVWEALAYVYARSGQQVQAQSALAKWEHWNGRPESQLTSTVLITYVATGNRDKALALLQKALPEHSSVLVTLKVEPGFDPLRSDPSFQDLLRRVGLADAGPNAGSTAPP